MTKVKNKGLAHLGEAVKAYAPLVVKGTKLLNEKVPGWTKPNKPSISDLQLDNSRACVLGQLAAKIYRLAFTGW